MKNLLRSLFLSTALLFNSVYTQSKFSKDYETKVMYNGRLHIVDQYKVDNQKRKHTYEVHTVNEYGQRGEFIGDEPSEFEAYKNVALSANYFLDRYYMVEDLTKIKNLFEETNQYFQASKLIHGATLEVTQFGTEVALMNKVTKEKLAQKVKRQYGKKLEKFGEKLAKEIIEEFKQGTLKDKKDLERIVKSQFHPSINKADASIDNLTALQDYLKGLNKLDYEEFLEFRERLYDNLREGYENQAMQFALVLAINKPAVKSAYIGDRILKTGLSRIDEGDYIYKELKKLGIDIEKIDDALSFYIQNYVNDVLNDLELGLYLEEEQFNPANKNSLAYKFLKDRFKKDNFEDFSLEKLVIKAEDNSCADWKLEDRDVLLQLRNCSSERGHISWLKIDLPYDFKSVDSAKISFDVENIKGTAINLVIGVADYDIPKVISHARSSIGRAGIDAQWVVVFDNVKDSVYMKVYYPNFGLYKDFNFDLSKLSRWIFRIIANASNSDSDLIEARFRIKNLKIN